MNKIYSFFPLIILIAYSCTYTESSSCLETSLLNESNENRNLNLELTEDDCRNKATSDKTNFICLLSEDHKYCEELPKSECITKHLEAFSNEKLNNNDCKGLKTSNRAYRCVLNIDGNHCVEKIKKLRVLSTDYDYDDYDYDDYDYDDYDYDDYDYDDYDYDYDDYDYDDYDYDDYDYDDYDDDYDDDDDDYYYYDYDDDDYDYGDDESECEETIYGHYQSLSEEYCNNLGTFSHRTRCTLSSSGNYCVERYIDSALYRVKFSLFTLCLLFLF